MVNMCQTVLVVDMVRQYAAKTLKCDTGMHYLCKTDTTYLRNHKSNYRENCETFGAIEMYSAMNEIEVLTKPTLWTAAT